MCTVVLLYTHLAYFLSNQDDEEREDEIEPNNNIIQRIPIVKEVYCFFNYIDSILVFIF